MVITSVLIRSSVVALCLGVPVLASGQQYKPLPVSQEKIQCGADRMERYLPLITGINVGLIANQTSRVREVHLLDTLLSADVNVRVVFAPEHGFRGEAEAGGAVVDGTDGRTGIRVISLYGAKQKPDKEDLSGIDVLLFDIQDVGTRFYTYLSTLHYVMEAGAEFGVPIIVLDRPNPNGFYVDGPILEKAYRSFVGLHPVPIVHGMTLGEYARMINGEGWLPKGEVCALSVIPCSGWDHTSEYILPVRPSPNLPNQTSVYLYPSLCLFEGTDVSIGRGTPWPFQVWGHPDFALTFSFIPKPVAGASENPKQNGKTCNGVDLREGGVEQVREKSRLILDWLLEAYQNAGFSPDFFNNYFEKLAGTSSLREQIMAGWSAAEIGGSWQKGISAFMEIRRKYLLYTDFE